MSYLPLFNKLLSGVFVCQPASVHGATRFVAPWCNLPRAGWEVRGFEGREVKGSLAPQKHSTTQRANIRGTGERLFIMQAVIFIVSSGKSLSPAFRTESGRFPTMNQGRAFTLELPGDVASAFKEPLFLGF